MGRRPDSTLGKRKIVIGMLTAGMMNKQIVRHFQACQSMISSLRTKIRQMCSVENRSHADRLRKTTRREDIEKMTSFRRNRFLSRTRMPGLVRNATGTRICAKTVQRRLEVARLCWRRPYVVVPLTVYINV